MRANSIMCFLVFLFLLLTPRLGFAGGPENTIVVINADSDSSKLIGNFYVTQRKIPAQNVVYLNNVPNRDIIGLPLCKARILLPIAEYIKKQGLNQQIDYIIYSTDFPSKIDVFKQAKEFVIKRESMGISTNDRLHLGGSSISSVTYFLSDILQNNSDFIALDANKYFRKRNVFTTEKVFNGIEQENFKDAVRKVELKKHDQASELLADLIQRHPRQPALHYWAAKNSAGLGDIENCIRFLKAAVRHGFAWRKFIANDRAFKPMIDDEAFQKFLQSVPPNSVTHLPTRHFDSNYLWGRNGFVNGDALHGESYVLSTILGVTRNKGNSEREVLDYLQRSINADGTRPKGTFYFCDTSDVRNRTRRGHYDLAIQELQRLGHHAQIAAQVLPKQVDDIAGLMFGTPNFDFKKTGSQILPGAICENLTSYGGALQPSIGQTKFTELLRFGAAGSCGTVREPYAI